MTIHSFPNHFLSQLNSYLMRVILHSSWRGGWKPSNEMIFQDVASWMIASSDLWLVETHTPAPLKQRRGVLVPSPILSASGIVMALRSMTLLQAPFSAPKLDFALGLVALGLCFRLALNEAAIWTRSCTFTLGLSASVCLAFCGGLMGCNERKYESAESSHR